MISHLALYNFLGTPYYRNTPSFTLDTILKKHQTKTFQLISFEEHMQRWLTSKAYRDLTGDPF